jgi:hypothetical protein
MGGSQHPDPGSRIRDEQPGSYFLELRNHFFAFLGVKILKFFDEDPGSGMETVRFRDPSDPGSGINIPDPPHCIQHCFICRASDSTVSEDAGIKPRTVATLALTARCSITWLDLIFRILALPRMQKNNFAD